MTSEALAVRRTPAAALRDLVELAKPRLTLLVVFTAGIGLALAPSSIGWARSGLFLMAVALLVASANTLNCWLERQNDGLMARTRRRPLPAGRLDPRVAFAIGVLLAAYSIPILAIVANPLTALLGGVAHVTYVLVYTPLKRVTPFALEIGAVPGAIPPVMGWTAATGELSSPAFLLFGILFAWQLPHFLAASIYLKEDYRRGGFRVWPVVKGDAPARRLLLAYTLLLLAVTIAAAPLGLAGTTYGTTAVVLGAGFLVFAAAGLHPRAGGAWARRVFLYSIVYLPALATVLALDSR